MKYAIIAAGEGSRLAQEGIAVPKPLVRLNGESLIERLIRIFRDNGATEITAITRTPMQLPQEVTHLVKATPSSMHSFAEITRGFGYDVAEPFIVTTVDTIFDEARFRDYVETLEQAVKGGEADGVMAVTEYIDDEKPLYVETNDEGYITAFLDSDPEHQCRYISAGIYGLTPKALATLRRCLDEGQSRMRNFQRAMIADGLKLKAFNLGKVIDIDHAGDIAKAEEIKGLRD